MKTIILAAAYIFSASCIAAEQSELDKCLDKAEGVTTRTRNCLHVEISNQNKRLNNNYASLLKRERSLDSERGVKDPKYKAQIALRSAQRAWIIYRDKECGYVYNHEGTISLIKGDERLLELTKQRADELAQYIKTYN